MNDKIELKSLLKTFLYQKVFPNGNKRIKKVRVGRWNTKRNITDVLTMIPKK